MTDDAHIIWGAEAAILEWDDVGYVYLGNLGPVAIAGVTYATATELAPITVTSAYRFLKGRALPVRFPASNGHSSLPKVAWTRSLRIRRGILGGWADRIWL